MLDNRCLFIVKGKRCINKKYPLSLFCDEHKKHFAHFDNKTLLNMTVQYFRDCLYVNENKKISLKMDNDIWANFTNCMNELTARGYRFDEVGKSITQIINDKGIFEDIYKKIGHNPKWKKFEKIVAGIHKFKSQGAAVQFNDFIIGKRTKRKRQIDVSVRFDYGYYQYLLIIECKDYKSRIPIGVIEAFKTKLEDVGANKGVLVTQKGFQKGAIEAAKEYGIELFTLTEEFSDWTKKIRNFIFKIPFPIDIQFDHPEIGKIIDIEGTPIKLAEIVFYDESREPAKKLIEIIIDISHWAHINKIKLPITLNVKLEKKYFLKIPKTEKYLQIYGLKMKLINYEFKKIHEIDIAPKVLNYDYSDIDEKSKFKIPIEKIEI